MVKLLKRLCPNKHLLCGTFYDDAVETPEAARQQMHEMGKLAGVFDVCSICGSDQMSVEEESTEFATMEDAHAHIAATVAHESDLRQQYRGMKPGPATGDPLYRGAGGKYDVETEGLCRTLAAQAVLLIVLGGVKGQGFSVCLRDQKLQEKLPAILREVASAMEAENS